MLLSIQKYCYFILFYRNRSSGSKDIGFAVGGKRSYIKLFASSGDNRSPDVSVRWVFKNIFLHLLWNESGQGALNMYNLFWVRVSRASDLGGSPVTAWREECEGQYFLESLNVFQKKIITLFYFFFNGFTLTETS